MLRRNSGGAVFVAINVFTYICFFASTWLTYDGLKGNSTLAFAYIAALIGGGFIFLAYALRSHYSKRSTKGMFHIAVWVWGLWSLAFLISFVSNTASTVKYLAADSFYENELAHKQTLLVKHIGRYQNIEDGLIPEDVRKRRDEFNALITNFRIQVLDPGAPGLGGRAREIQNQLLSPRFVGNFTKTRFPSTAQCKTNMKTCEAAVDSLIENYTKQFESLTIKPLLSKNEAELNVLAEAKAENTKLLDKLAELLRKRESAPVVQETKLTGGAGYISTQYQQAMVNLIKDTVTTINTQNDRLEILGVQVNEPKAVFDNAGLGELNFFVSKLVSIYVSGEPGYEEVKPKLTLPIFLAFLVDILPLLLDFVANMFRGVATTNRQRPRFA